MQIFVHIQKYNATFYLSSYWQNYWITYINAS